MKNKEILEQTLSYTRMIWWTLLAGMITFFYGIKRDFTSTAIFFVAILVMYFLFGEGKE